MVEGDIGSFYLVNHYLNYVDSQTGLDVGERGLELMILKFH